MGLAEIDRIEKHSIEKITVSIHSEIQHLFPQFFIEGVCRIAMHRISYRPGSSVDAVCSRCPISALQVAAADKRRYFAYPRLGICVSPCPIFRLTRIEMEKWRRQPGNIGNRCGFCADLAAGAKRKTLGNVHFFSNRIKGKQNGNARKSDTGQFHRTIVFVVFAHCYPTKRTAAFLFSYLQ